MALLRQLPVLEARELIDLKQVSAYAYFDKNTQREINANLVLRAYPEPPVQTRKPILEHNPEKAAAWFAARGMKVVN